MEQLIAHVTFLLVASALVSTCYCHVAIAPHVFGTDAVPVTAVVQIILLLLLLLLLACVFTAACVKWFT